MCVWSQMCVSSAPSKGPSSQGTLACLGMRPSVSVPQFPGPLGMGDTTLWLVDVLPALEVWCAEEAGRP